MGQKNIQLQNRMGRLLEDIINRHKLYITTELPYTFNPITLCMIDLTSVRGLKHVQVMCTEFEFIKSGHLAIEVLIEDPQQLKTPTKV